MIVGALDLDEDKPSTVPVRFVANKLGIALDENVWFIGDTETDMKCAIDSGCFPVLYGDIAIRHNILYIYQSVVKVKDNRF